MPTQAPLRSESTIERSRSRFLERGRLNRPRSRLRPPCNGNRPVSRSHLQMDRGRRASQPPPRSYALLLMDQQRRKRSRVQTRGRAQTRSAGLTPPPLPKLSRNVPPIPPLVERLHVRPKIVPPSRDE